MNKKQRRFLERNLTHEQKVRLFLWNINKNIVNGVACIIAFMLMLICSLTESFLFGLVSLIGMWIILINLWIIS